jgi:hypothetical protein
LSSGDARQIISLSSQISSEPRLHSNAVSLDPFVVHPRAGVGMLMNAV